MSTDDDEPPDGQEAEAQSEQTIMPWIWGAIGLLVIAAFVAFAFIESPRHPTPAPLMPPSGQPPPNKQ